LALIRGVEGLLRRSLVCFAAVFALVFFVVDTPACVFAVATADEAQAAIDGAQARLATYYEAAVQAENAGGNVTELATVLNGAGALLSQARVASENTEYDLAIDFASNCTDMLEGFAERADTLAVSAAQGRFFDFMVNVVGSTVGAVAVVIAGWILWINLKKRYEKVGSAI
jgi:hypothetical protein